MFAAEGKAEPNLAPNPSEPGMTSAPRHVSFTVCSYGVEVVYTRCVSSVLIYSKFPNHELRSTTGYGCMRRAHTPDQKRELRVHTYVRARFRSNLPRLLLAET